MLETSSRDWEHMFLRRRRGVKTDPREKRKNPASAGLFQCAREDSNLHGPNGPQGPQPCASTSSATGAGRASIALRGLPPAASFRGLESVCEARYSHEHMFVSICSQRTLGGTAPWSTST